MRRHEDARRAGSRRLAAGLVLGLVTLTLSGGAAAEPGVDAMLRRAGRRAAEWYERTPPGERVTWGGLMACAGLGLLVAAERSARVRRRRIIPVAFAKKFQARLAEGRLDRSKALDYCELNPSPAARVALAAVGRWGRPMADLERAVALAR